MTCHLHCHCLQAQMLIEDEDPFIIMLKRNKNLLHKLLLFWNAVWLKGVVLLLCICEGLDRSAAARDGNNYLDFCWNFSLRSLTRVQSNWDSAQHQSSTGVGKMGWLRLVWGPMEWQCLGGQLELARALMGAVAPHEPHAEGRSYGWRAGL